MTNPGDASADSAVRASVAERFFTLDSQSLVEVPGECGPGQAVRVHAVLVTAVCP